MKQLLTILLISLSSTAFAQISIVQDTTVKLEAKTYFDTVEVRPKFKGNMYDYMMKNFKFPQGVTPKGSINTVLWIDTTGKVSQVEVVGKKPKSYTPVEKEVVRVLKGMPRWAPGSTGGKKMTVKYSLPLNFN